MEEYTYKQVDNEGRDIKAMILFGICSASIGIIVGTYLGWLFSLN